MALNSPHLVGIRVAAIRQRMPVCAVLIVSVLVPSTFARAYAAVAAFLVLLKLGGRFCRNAVSASFASSERTCALNSAFSACIAALICSRKDCFMSFLLAWSAPAGFAASFRAVSLAVARRFWSDTT